MKFYSFIIVMVAFFLSCDTGRLNVIANLPVSLTEVSAIETVPGSELLWVIEDSGNRASVYGLDSIGNIARTINIKNGTNNDWEDLTTDDVGNLYIGDFGNNRRNRVEYIIYKTALNSSGQNQAEIIKFKLPETSSQRDFEAFFIKDEFFYIFSKEDKDVKAYKVPNITGKHVAELVSTYSFKGRGNKITSADISSDGKTIVLLSHSKCFRLTNFKEDNFFMGKIDVLNFNHTSQKEGVCFYNPNTLLITDEHSGVFGGNIYSYFLSSENLDGL